MITNQLNEIAATWGITLTSHEVGPCVIEWRLVLHGDHAHGYAVHTYRGTDLESVVREAYTARAGEPGRVA